MSVIIRVAGRFERMEYRWVSGGLKGLLLEWKVGKTCGGPLWGDWRIRRDNAVKN